MTTDYAPETHNGQHAPARPDDHYPPDVEFGALPTQVIPHDWAGRMLTRMREHELAGGKPKHFSVWLAEIVMENR